MDKNNLSQGAAAEQIKISRTHLNKILNGREIPSVALLKRMEEVMDKNIIYYKINNNGISSFLHNYKDEMNKAIANLQEEYSLKIFMYLFLKLYCPSEKDENPDSFSIEELCAYVHCSSNELIPSLNELVEKGYLIQEFDENGEIDSFGFDINPTKEN